MIAALVIAVNIGALEAGDNVATLTSGTEHGLMVGAGYGHALVLADRLVLVGGDAMLGLGDLDTGDFRLRATALAPVIRASRWQVLCGLAATFRGTHNEMARMLDFGADVSVAAGYYAPRWFAAVDGGFDWAATTHIAPSDEYRMQVYAGARDGWYGNTGGIIHAGVQGGVSFGRSDISLRAGRLLASDGAPAMFPVYATLGYALHW